MKPITAEDIMIDINFYPHIHSNVSIREALDIMNTYTMLVNGKTAFARAILVFDDDYDLIGLVQRRDLLRGVEDGSLFEHTNYSVEQPFAFSPDPNLLELSYKALVYSLKEKAELPVKNIMVPLKQFVNYDDHIFKIMYELQTNRLLPVLKDENVVGIVRTVEVMNEIERLLKDEFEVEDYEKKLL